MPKPLSADILDSAATAVSNEGEFALFPFRGQTPCAGAPPFARLDRDFLQ